MSQSIDNVNIQIPGTMYYLQLTADRGRWILALILRGDVENEVTVPVFSKNGIIKAANELLNNSRLVIDKYPLKNVCDQLFSEAERSLPVSQIPQQEEIIDNEEIDEIKQKLDLLETTLNNVNEELKESVNIVTERLDSLENERVARLEAEIKNNVSRGNEEMLTSFTGRLDKIEESIAETKGDDRVPSILTAIEAFESKLSQLEGKTVTTGGISPVVGTATVADEDIGGLKNDIGKLSQAFDLINQRLTVLEAKAKPQIETPPAVVEGAPIIQPPTTTTETPTRPVPPTTEERKFTEE
ncbi:MAG: hypothetical protein ACTSSH_04330 [Candidatus Heimdallarchaeota archaeon]